MQLDPNKFRPETVNHMRTQFTHEDCPQQGKACFQMAMGAPYGFCEFFKSEEDKPTAECIYGDTEHRDTGIDPGQP